MRYTASSECHSSSLGACQSIGITPSAANSSAGSRSRLDARRGMCRAISAATASAATQRGPGGEAITRRARPPMRADRTTFASATTAGGSEIAEYLLFVHVLRLQRRADLLG